MLYDDDFISTLPKFESSWKNPLILHVANEVTDKYKNLKNLIEKWYSRISDDKKAEYSSRLKSFDDEIFIA